jgi:hypothetical protein
MVGWIRKQLSKSNGETQWACIATSITAIVKRYKKGKAIPVTGHGGP